MFNVLLHKRTYLVNIYVPGKVFFSIRNAQNQISLAIIEKRDWKRRGKCKHKN
jgi:hypothetical protein